MTTEAGGAPGLYRLLAWLSPSFPTGAFSYSHGLEAAVADGTVRDRASLQAWVGAIVAQGSGRVDADILCAAYRAASAGDGAALEAANRQGIAFRATAELALESAQQGDAFLATCRAAWPDAAIEAWREGPLPNPLPQAGEGVDWRASNNPLPQAGEGVDWRAANNPPPQAGESRVGVFTGDDVCHSAAFGALAVTAGIALRDAILGYLQAFAANLVSGGIRLGVIGQTDGQRILAALEPVVAAAAAAAIERDPEDFGAATFAADLASMAHETQYTRLFRS